MAKKLRVGIVGAGAIGTVHANAYKAVDEIETAAFCDVNETALQKAADTFGVSNCFTDFDQFLKSDVDVVNVSVGNVLHKKFAVAALRAGKHVFLEKPMAMNSAEAQEINNEAKKAGKVLQIGMVRRFSPQAQVIRECYKKGMLGEVYHTRAVLMRRRGIPGLGGWFTTMSQSGGGPMIDIGVHWFDAAMYLSDQWEPTAVSAKTYAKFGPRMKDYVYTDMWAGPPKYDGVFDVEDYSTGLVRFGEKATMSFEIAWACNAESPSFVELLGDKGGVRYDSGASLVVYTEHGGRVADIQLQYDNRENIFEGQARALLANCRGKKNEAATGQQGVTLMRLIDAIYASGKANQEVSIRK
ncbi:MAG: Gfo/Idh/MocA family oxidoreductase [Phycisphaerae bacterium]|nr:Gfo/Idh/MocA family oxidoreductase [Phycisphaerae bacterium]